jgi:hypothetical protein
MSAKISIKIDGFYFLLLGVLGLSLFLVVVTYKTVSQSLAAINQPPEKPSVLPLTLNKENLSKAYEWVFNKKIVSLDSNE